MPHGKLEVHVTSAVIKHDDTGIYTDISFGKESPYCTLTTGSQEQSTPPEGGSRPCFNKKFEFQFDRTTEQLTVEIFSKKKLRADVLLGHCRIIFKDAFFHGHVVPVKPYALTRTNGQPGGHVRLSLTFKAQPVSTSHSLVPLPLLHVPVFPPVSSPSPQISFHRPRPRRATFGFPTASNRFKTEEDSDSDDDYTSAPHEGQHHQPHLREPRGAPSPMARGAPPPTLDQLIELFGRKSS